ncbi:MAG: hypothetical protein J0L93_02270 [Deltaproteobacteria bacterium]|nr:hypothetical protein [Deltaproteobacteria bacterium]
MTQLNKFLFIGIISIIAIGCGSDKNTAATSKKFAFSIDGDYDFTDSFCNLGSKSAAAQEAYNYFPMTLNLVGTKAVLETIYSSTCSSFSNDTVDELSADTIVIIKGAITCSAACNTLDPCIEKAASGNKQTSTYTFINSALMLTDSANYGNCQDSNGKLIRSFTIR